jgi:ParB-like chromosome segregation protein Spo0J
MAELQSFVMERMRRSQLKAAAYNPRIIGEAEKRKLRAGLKRHGLVAPITFNRRTGNVVGGHQRLAALDGLEDSPDYELDVAVIDVSEAEEKEINILLNNASAMGDWDLGELSGLLKDK